MISPYTLYTFNIDSINSSHALHHNKHITQIKVFITLFIALLLRDERLLGTSWETGMDVILTFMNILTPLAAFILVVYDGCKVVPAEDKAPANDNNNCTGKTPGGEVGKDYLSEAQDKVVDCTRSHHNDSRRYDVSAKGKENSTSFKDVESPPSARRRPEGRNVSGPEAGWEEPLPGLGVSHEHGEESQKELAVQLSSDLSPSPDGEAPVSANASRSVRYYGKWV